MENFSHEECKRVFDILPGNQSKWSFDILLKLIDHLDILGIMLGGSLSYKSSIERADVDLFCLTNNAKNIEGYLNDHIKPLPFVDVIIHQGFFPWTEELFTIYFKTDLSFSVDICLIDQIKIRTFFWEPEGKIIYDPRKLIQDTRVSQVDSPTFTRHPFLKQNPFAMSIVSLKKISKNIMRNHLWNALEQSNALRRYIMQIIRLQVIKDFAFLGRVDRDFEDVCASSVNQALSQTVAFYDPADISKKTCLLAKILLGLLPLIENTPEHHYKSWVLSQLLEEQEYLQKQYSNA